MLTVVCKKKYVRICHLISDTDLKNMTRRKPDDVEEEMLNKSGSKYQLCWRVSVGSLFQ